MRVLHVGPKNYPPSHGGTERVVFDIISGSEDIDSYILVEFEREESRNIKTMPKGYFQKFKFIAKYVKEEKIDIVHFHNETFVPLALMYSLINKKNLVTVHGCHFTNPKYNWFQRISILIFDIIGAIFLPRLVFCSEVDKNKFKKWVPFRKIYFVPNGIQLPNFEMTKSDELKNTIVYLGRISPEKNLIRLINKADSLRFSLHIYGAFDERRSYFNQLVKKELKNSHYAKWKGSVPYTEVLNTISKYKTFIYPSVSEGLPLSVLEAAACGLNLILSDIPQHRVLKFPVATYINPYSFNLNPISLINSGLANRKHVEENFSIKQMVDGYKKIYNSLI